MLVVYQPVCGGFFFVRFCFSNYHLSNIILSHLADLHSYGSPQQLQPSFDFANANVTDFACFWREPFICLVYRNRYYACSIDWNMNLNMFNQLFEVPLIRVELSVSKGPTLLPTKLKKYATIFNIYFEFLQEKASRERKRERIMFF